MIIIKKKEYTAIAVAILSLLLFYAIPEKTAIPVIGANSSDWNPYFFWDCPWCTKYDKHKGIDIIKDEGTPVISSTNGIIIYSGWLGKYGNATIILSPKLRLHLYGHLGVQSRIFPLVMRGTVIGAVGNTGSSDCPHLHYTIISILPEITLFEKNNMGWLKMFVLNPDRILKENKKYSFVSF